MSIGKKQPGRQVAVTESEEVYHVPVLLHESVDGLEIKPAGVYIDCTFGGGGHSREILKRLGQAGRLFAFDQDADARRNVTDDPRLVFIPQNFRHMEKFLRLQGIDAVDGILADLGVSSFQFDEAERGFSIRFDAALDMRMDRRQTLTAADVLQNTGEQDLHKIFEQYGEVSNAKTLAKTIVEKRKSVPLDTIEHFKVAIQQVVMGNPNKYLAKVFQAIRIVVNDEMGALKTMLEQSGKLLKSGGRLSIITFHSLEDRMVKQYMKQGSFEIQTDDVYGNRNASIFKIITKKPIVASEQEQSQNSRSRSAKLRIAEKK